MLIDDVYHANKLPSPLQNLLQKLFGRNVKSAELLVAFVYYAFLESGCVPAAMPVEQKSKIPAHWGYSYATQIPEYSWSIVADQISEQFNQWEKSYGISDTSNASKSDQIFEFKLNLLKYSTDEMHLVIRKIFGGNALCATFCIDQQEKATSIVLPIAQFINENAINGVDFHTVRQNPQQYFTNICELTKNVKQILIMPLHNSAMYDIGVPHAALSGLPKEVLWTLFKYVRSDLKTLQNISRTCVYLRNMAISFLNEKNIQLKQRQPTAIVHDTSEPNVRRRFQRFDVDPWLFYRYNDFFPRFRI